MEKETKYGYGFLLAGTGLPYLMDKLLGETAAIITAALFLLIGIAFLGAAALHKAEPHQPTRRLSKLAIAGALVLIGSVVWTTWWIVAHPDMQAIIVGSSTGEIVERLPHYDTGVALNVDLLNSGPPSITKDWALSLELDNGEKFQGALDHSTVTGWADDTGTIVNLDLSHRPFVDQMTATTPMAKGARLRGVLLFIFPDLPRQRVDNVNNKLILSFKDVRQRAFKTIYRFPASTAFVTDQPNTAQPESAEPSERGDLHVVERSLRVDRRNTYDIEAWIKVENIGKLNILPTAMIRCAIVPSSQLMDSAAENVLFEHRPEWQSGGGFTFDNTLVHGDSQEFHCVYPWAVEPDTWNELQSGRQVIYLVTRATSRDRLGRLPDLESCRYISYPDWQTIKPCFGHNN